MSMVQNTIVPPRILLTAVKRNVLVGKICRYCIVLAIVHSILNASQGLYDSVVVNLLFGLIVGFAYLLNSWRHHRPSKVFVLLFLNFLCFFYTSVLPGQMGVYLYF